MSSILTGSSPRGPTDKASDYESGDCGFESHRGCIFVLFGYIIGSQVSTALGSKNKKVLPGLEPGSLDSESRVITITL